MAYDGDSRLMTHDRRPPAHDATRRTRHAVLTAAVLVMYLLHQDIWFWNVARPLVFGFVPIGLFYHAVYSVAVAGLMMVLVRYAWPATLDAPDESQRPLSTREDQ